MPAVKETKELVDLGLSLGKAIKDGLADGKLAVDDLTHLMLVVPKIGPAFENIAQVPAELTDLDTAEATEILDFVKSKMPDITDSERVQKIAASALSLGLAAAQLVTAIRT